MFFIFHLRFLPQFWEKQPNTGETVKQGPITPAYSQAFPNHSYYEHSSELQAPKATFWPIIMHSFVFT